MPGLASPVVFTDLADDPPTSVLVHRPTLADRSADAALEARGFAAVDFWGVDVARELRTAYLALAPEDDPELTVDYMRDDRSLVRRLQELLDGVLDHAVESAFVNHRVLQTTFVTKQPGPGSAMYLHEDRTRVDERFHRSVTVWAPLDSVGPSYDNGGLEVIADSHGLPLTWSGVGTPDLIRPFEGALAERLERPAVDAGRALVYDSRLLHSSPANQSAEARVAVICSVIPNDARAIFIRATGRRHRQVFGVDRQFFSDHHPHDLELGMPEECPMLGEYDEEARLRPSVLADLTAGCEARAVVPDDLVADVVVGRFEDVVPLGEIQAPSVARDVPVDLLSDQGGPEGPPLATVTVTTGACRTLKARRGGVTVPGLAQALEPVCREATPSEVDLDVVLLGPRTRATIHAGDPDLHLVVVDGPVLGAGICRDGRVANIDLGTRARIERCSSLLMWNDGPGLVALLVGRRPAVSTRS